MSGATVDEKFSQLWKIAHQPEYHERFVLAANKLAEQGDVSTLASLFEMFVCGSQVIMGFWNRPAISDNPVAEEFAEAERSRMFNMAEIVATALRGMTIIEKYDVCRRAEILTQWEFESGGGINDAMVALAKASAIDVKRPEKTD
jgi:hypothetical protein